MMSNNMRAKEGNRGKRLGVGEDRASICLCFSGFLSPPPPPFSPLFLKLSCVPSSRQVSDREWESWSPGKGGSGQWEGKEPKALG